MPMDMVQATPVQTEMQQIIKSLHPNDAKVLCGPTAVVARLLTLGGQMPAVSLDTVIPGPARGYVFINPDDHGVTILFVPEQQQDVACISMLGQYDGLAGQEEEQPDTQEN